MKLRQFFIENNQSGSPSLETLIEKGYFRKETGRVTRLEDGSYDIDGPLVAESKKFKLNKETADHPNYQGIFPFKIRNAKRVDLMQTELSSLMNMPDKCSKLQLTLNKITSLESNIIECEVLDLTSNLMTDFTGLKLKGSPKISVNSCKNLVSLNGLDKKIPIPLVALNNCVNFTDDLTQYKNIESITVDLDTVRKMPIIDLICFGEPRLNWVDTDRRVFSNNENLQKIIVKYIGKGSEEMINLTADLYNQKFIDLATYLKN